MAALAMDMKKSIIELAELGLILTASLIPLFLLAKEVDRDEFVKAGSGLFLASTTAVVIGIYRLWKSNNTKSGNDK